jgi:hypothetical protein
VPLVRRGEENKMKKHSVLFVVVCAALMTLVAQAAEPDIAVLPAEVQGAVLLPDGRPRVDGVRVSVWNADTERTVYRSRSSKDGTFTVPRLTEGNHYVMVGPVKIDMRVLTARAGVAPQPHGFVVVVPQRMPLMPILVPGAAAAAAVPTIVSP